MHRWFALDMPASRFARNTLFASMLGLAPLLLVYVLQTPGFAAALLDGGPPLSRFVRQVLTNGLPVVFAVNYVSFFQFAWISAAQPGKRATAIVLLVDLPMRVILFVVMHAAIYVASADWFGSFGGSRLTALGVVAPTLARSALFENISGVYLYATLASALPLYVAAIEKSGFAGGQAVGLAGRIWSVFIAMLLFGFFALALTAVAAALVSWNVD